MDNLPPHIREKVTEQLHARFADPEYRQKFSENARALSKARWADPEMRAKMVEGMRKTGERKRRNRKCGNELSALNKRRSDTLKKIRFLPGAERIVKWLVR